MPVPSQTPDLVAAAPTLTAIDPTTRTGAGPLTLTATGTGFLRGAVLVFDSVALATTVDGVDTLTASGTIPVGTRPGTFPVLVRNLDGKESAPLDFTYATPGAALVTLATAKQQLRITDTLHDADVQAQLDAAEAIVLDYLKPTWVGGVPRGDLWPWTPNTLPRVVEQAILLMVTHLYEHRGDDMTPASAGGTPDADVWLAIERLLIRRRD